MNVFIIGSDKTLVGAVGVGDAPARHAEYGRHVDHIDILVYTKKGEGLRTFPISSNVRGLPSNSFSKPLFFFDAFKIFQEVNKEHPVDLVVSQDPFFFGLTGYWLKRKYKVKLIVNFHGDFWGNKFWLRERLLNRLFLLLSFFVMPHCDAVRVVSSSIKKKLVERGVAEEKIEVISTAINPKNFEKASSQEVSQIREHYHGKKLVLFVGRLHQVKNLPFLIESFALVKRQLESSCLLVVGDGPEIEKLGLLAKRLNLEKDIFFLGPLEHKKIVNFYHAACLLVLPSLSEGLPKVLIEGGLCGLPLLATEADWSKEIIKEGLNGYLVPLGDQKTFSLRMISLLENDSLRERMGESSLSFARSYLSSREGKLVEFWKKVVSA
ncbi:MAG: group 1 glycosyl transferase [Parcubacteria group bacterium Gr01-1014_107]|nr:MAG: group 1 glycosyl transferase [Parcubacteria group bacterium Gr01-1014_107]